MKVLVGCEESQTITIAFRNKGHEAYSCDLQPCSGGHPEWHLHMDVFDAIDLVNPTLGIFHPPCTFISKAGARWLYQNGILNEERYKKGLLAKEFFLKLLNAKIEKICIENPTPMKIFDMPKFTQAIQPYMFGNPYSKRTLLWLKNLPKLYHNGSINLFDEVVTHTKTYEPYLPSNTGGKKKGQKYSFGISKNAKESSKTFAGIAAEMANQWSNFNP